MKLSKLKYQVFIKEAVSDKVGSFQVMCKLQKLI